MSRAERLPGSVAVRSFRREGPGFIGPVDPSVTAHLHLGATTDLSLVHDGGTILDVAIGSVDLGREGLRSWVGKPLSSPSRATASTRRWPSLPTHQEQTRHAPGR